MIFEVPDNSRTPFSQFLFFLYKYSLPTVGEKTTTTESSEKSTEQMFELNLKDRVQHFQIDEGRKVF